MGISCKQLNAGGRTEVWDNLRLMFGSPGNQTKVIFMQEMKAQNIPNATIFRETRCKLPRAGIVMDKNFADCSGAILMTNFSSRDQAAVSLKLKFTPYKCLNVVFCSVYMPNEDQNQKTIKPNDIITPEHENLVRFCNQSSTHLLLGIDSNAHCVEWASKANKTEALLY